MALVVGDAASRCARCLLGAIDLRAARTASTGDREQTCEVVSSESLADAEPELSGCARRRGEKQQGPGGEGVLYGGASGVIGSRRVWGKEELKPCRVAAMGLPFTETEEPVGLI